MNTFIINFESDECENLVVKFTLYHHQLEPVVPTKYTK